MACLCLLFLANQSDDDEEDFVVRALSGGNPFDALYLLIEWMVVQLLLSVHVVSKYWGAANGKITNSSNGASGVIEGVKWKRNDKML